MARLFRSMKNIQLWITLSVGTLMVLVLVFAFVARKPLCIDSKLVERIDSISSSGTATAYRCGLHKHVDFDENLALEIKTLGRKLQVLEKYFEWMGGLQKRVSITVIANSDNFYRIQDHQIFIGDRFLKAEGQIEKVILKVWLNERASGALRSQPVVTESLSDLLYFSLSGEFNVQEIGSKFNLGDDFDSRWPRVLNNFAGYCRSPWRLNEDLTRCERESEIQKRAVDEVENLSLRPLLSQSMIAAYKKLRSSERLSWLANLGQSLNTMAFNDDFLMADSSFLLKETIRFISLLDIQLPYRQFSVHFENELKERGFSDFQQISRSYDFLVFVEDLSSPWLKQIKQANQNHRIAIEFQGQQIANEESQIPLQAMDVVSGKNGIVIRCGEINFETIKQLSHQVDKLLYIRSCGQDNIDLTAYFEKGVSGLAAKNRNLQFIEFHTSSLRLALKRNPRLENLKILESTTIQANFFDHLGWEKPEFDTQLKAYRANSVIEAVDWYRL